MNRTTWLASALAVTTFAYGAAQAEYPEGPVTLIVAFSPGGGTDVAARTIEPFIERHLGAEITVLNRPGAGGEIGFSELASADPDGYTIGFINLPAMFAYSYERETLYARDSFTPIGNVVSDPGVFVVRSDSEFETLSDLVEFGVANPGALPIGTSGSVGSSEHLAILQVQSLTGAAYNHVPFGSTAPLRTALWGGHVPVAAFNLSEAVQFMEEGSLRVLGVMSEERNEMAPDVPTFMEQGIDVVTGSSRGIAGPAGLSPDVTARLSAAIQAAIEDPEYQEMAASADVPLNYMDAEAYAEFLDRTWSALGEAWEANPWQQ